MNRNSKYDKKIYDLKIGDIVALNWDPNEHEQIDSIIFNDRLDFRNEDDGAERVTINGLFWNIDEVLIIKINE